MTTDQDALRARLHLLFLDELEEHVERIEDGLDRMADNLPELSADTVGEVFRSAHSLKGAAQAVGAATVASLCHHLEDALVRVREGSLEVDEQLLARIGKVVDVVSGLGHALRHGDEQPAVDVPAVVAGMLDGAQPAVEPAPVRTRPAPVPPAGEDEPTRGAVSPPVDTVTVRVARDKFDALLGQADTLITSSYGSERMVAQFSAVREQLSRDAEQMRRDHDVLGRALREASVAEPRVRAALDRIEARTRETSVEVDRLVHSAKSHHRELHLLASEFADAARRARTVPFTHATSGLNRMVRDLALQLGKQARLVVDAEDVEVDKELVTTIHDALGHVVRNAMDHGLEPPDERRSAGKAETGTIEIVATLRSGGIDIVVSDDGRGVDSERVRESAGALGLEGNGSAGLTDVLFHPGLSTASQVSAVSGRGVGLDAVRTAVEAIGGSVMLESEARGGTRVCLTVPLTLSTLRALLVRTGGDVVALPAATVQTLVRVGSTTDRLDGREVIHVDGRALPVVPLAGVLGWEADQAGERERAGLVMEGTEGSVVLVVDELLSEGEIVLRTIPRRLADLTVLLGTTQLADGAVALVLSPSVCVRVALARSPLPAPSPTGETPAPGRVLLVEDTMTTRELERSILESAGYTVVATVDGQQAWETLQASEFDVVLSDVNMPRMDGIALCQAIRGSRRLAELPVVLMTSLHSEADRRRGLDAGADAYLTKSGFDRTELLATIGRLL